MNQLSNTYITLNLIELSHLQRVSDIHIAAFPNSTLTEFGSSVVERYYEWQLLGPHEAYALGAFHRDYLVGYCFCGDFNRALLGFINKNKSFLFLQLFTHLPIFANRNTIDQASHVVRLMGRHLLRPQKKKNSSNSSIAASRRFGILAIATDVDYQGIGVGRLLMQHAEKIAVEQGCKEMTLSVNVDNHKAIQFYEGLGWERTLRGKTTWKMRKALKGETTIFFSEEMR